MNLDYELTFGKFKGKTLRFIIDNEAWYLNQITEVEWLVKKIRSEMIKSDLDILQKELTKMRKSQEIKCNNRIVMSYFPNYSTDACEPEP